MYNGATVVLLGCSYTFLGCKFLSSIFPLFLHPTRISKVISLHRWNNQAYNKALLPHSKKIWNEVNIFFHQSQQTLIRLNSNVLFLVTLFISIFNFLCSITGYAYYGEYPLSFAVCFGYMDIYDYLIDNGANPNLQDSFGNTALHMAVIADQAVSTT